MVMRQGLYLWPSTATKFDLMDAWLVSSGHPHMVISQPYGAYRSLADQIKVKAIYGKGAATPGYSNHGLGTAWDIYNIDQYPDAIIAQAAIKFGLKRDAGNGAGGIESWHMHDYDGIVPAGEDINPIPPTQEEIMTKGYRYVGQPDTTTGFKGEQAIGTLGYWRVLVPGEDASPLLNDLLDGVKIISAADYNQVRSFCLYGFAANSAADAK